MSKLLQLKSLPKIIKIKQSTKVSKIKIIGDPISIRKSESQIESEICSFLRENFILFWKIKIKGDPFMTRKGIRFKRNENRGFADIHCCFKGKAIYLEVKKCNGTCSLEQIKTQTNVRNNGGVYEFVTSVREVKEIFLRLGV